MHVKNQPEMQNHVRIIIMLKVWTIENPCKSSLMCILYYVSSSYMSRIGGTQALDDRLPVTGPFFILSVFHRKWSLF